MSERFTIDGSPVLESRLEAICGLVRERVLQIVGHARLEGLVLGGGYGRGEGGVLRTSHGDAPYNDLEFYVFLNGNRLWNQHRFCAALDQLGAALSPDAGLHVEFKIDSVRRFRSTPITMFSYDLVSGHRIIHGRPDLFRGCEHHLISTDIPVSEATRLLFNRCSGLLVAREYLRAGTVAPEQADFIERNLAKVRLALGDAVLASQGAYHWSCRERHKRLADLPMQPDQPWLAPVVELHRTGVLFKLQPSKTVSLPPDAQGRLAKAIETSRQVWLWIESRRLGASFSSIRDYALNMDYKPAHAPTWLNYLLSLRTFGLSAALAGTSRRYPRERLYDALALMLWHDGTLTDPDARLHLQQQLLVTTPEWQDCLSTYKKVWAAYG